LQHLREPGRENKGVDVRVAPISIGFPGRQEAD